MSRTLPYRPGPLRIPTHYNAHGIDQIHRVSPNRFGKAIRGNSAAVRQGFPAFMMISNGKLLCLVFYIKSISALLRANPANTKHLYNICTKSAQRLRRWPSIVQMSYKCFMFTPGKVVLVTL